MNLTKEDQARLSRYLQLLKGVSTRKNASVTGNSEIHSRGFVDTIELKPTLALSAEQVGKNCNGLGWTTKRTKLRDKRWYVEARSQFDTSVKFYFRKNMDGYITAILAKPDSFSNASMFLSTMKQLIYPYDLIDLGVSRIDFTCDFEMPFLDFLKCIEVKRKQIKIDYVSGGSKITGSYYGGGHEQILVYDKTAQANLPSDLSRLEVRVRGNKLPIRKASDLFEAKTLIERVAANNPFSATSIFDLEIDPLFSRKKIGQEFLTIYERQGFQAAKQQFNKGRNFERNIGGFLTKRPHAKQPPEILVEGLRDFFGE